MKTNGATPFLLSCIFLFLCACESDDGDMETPDLDTVGFTINVSGDLSRNMQGTNAYYRFQELPSSLTTTHQLSIYLSDGEGYTVTAIIGVNGASAPPPGNYPALNLTANGYNGDDPGTATFLFGQNGGISHSSNLQGQGGLSITTTSDGVLSGTLETPLVPTSNGSGNIVVSGTFTVEFRP
ncbi:hypothetical protein [Ulvibacterium sp.]|uniref:hypothetical protein n=1 Tax=Ulvibacterium sp. TaxID=2665914 RepID=UPI00261DA3EA|nr:hypothetical protein [Ulvibacterium sp.]